MTAYYCLIGIVVFFLALYMAEALSDYRTANTKEGYDSLLAQNGWNKDEIIHGMLLESCMRHLFYAGVLAIVLVGLLRSEVKSEKDGSTEIKCEITK